MNNEIKNINVGKMIKYYLKLNKMTMKELGIKLGKSESTVSKWVSGTSTPFAKDLSTMTYIFNTDIYTLLYGDENTPSILTKINEVSSKLEEERQKIVLDTANQQYKEQNKVAPIEKLQQPKITEVKWDTTTEIDNKKVACYTEDFEESYAEVPELPRPAAGPGGDVHHIIYDHDDITDYVLFPESKTPKNANYCFKVNGNSMESTFTDGQYAFVNTDVSISNGEIGIFILNGEALLKKLSTNNDDGYTHLVSLNPNYEDIIVTDNDRYYIVGKVVM